MLSIVVPDTELFNEKTNEFINVKGMTLELEHSLISVKKWEQKWHIPYLSNKNQKTDEQVRDYIRCMTINKVPDQNIYKCLTDENIKEIVDYIENPMTATWFSNNETIGASKNKKDVITAEIIYYWMIELNIPSEYQKWHLRSLLTLIKVVSIKSQPSKKMSAKEAAAQRKSLNAQRRARMHSKG